MATSLSFFDEYRNRGSDERKIISNFVMKVVEVQNSLLAKYLRISDSDASQLSLKGDDGIAKSLLIYCAGNKSKFLEYIVTNGITKDNDKIREYLSGDISSFIKNYDSKKNLE